MNYCTVIFSFRPFRNRSLCKFTLGGLVQRRLGYNLLASYSEMRHLIVLFGCNAIAFFQVGAIMRRRIMFLLGPFEHGGSPDGGCGFNIG